MNEEKPTAYWDGGDYVSLSNRGDAKIPLFTSPPKPWVGLTFEDETECLTAGNTGGWKGVMKATEAKLKGRNHAL